MILLRSPNVHVDIEREYIKCLIWIWPIPDPGPNDRIISIDWWEVALCEMNSSIRSWNSKLKYLCPSNGRSTSFSLRHQMIASDDGHFNGSDSYTENHIVRACPLMIIAIGHNGQQPAMTRRVRIGLLRRNIRNDSSLHDMPTWTRSRF